MAIILLAAGGRGMPMDNRAQNPLKAVSGFWYTEGHEGIVELYPCGDEICGRLHWIQDDGTEPVSRDMRNPDPDLRARPLCHLKFMGGFTPDGQGRYSDGWIYSPRHGATFNAEMKLIDHNTLDLRGYIFFPFLGESQTWKRAKKMPACASG